MKKVLFLSSLLLIFLVFVNNQVKSQNLEPIIHRDIYLRGPINIPMGRSNVYD